MARFIKHIGEYKTKGRKLFTRMSDSGESFISASEFHGHYYELRKLYYYRELLSKYANSTIKDALLIYNTIFHKFDL